MTSQLSIYFSLFAVHLRISSCVFSQDSDDLRLCWILTLLVPWNQDSVCISQRSSLLGKGPFFMLVTVEVGKSLPLVYHRQKNKTDRV